MPKKSKKEKKSDHASNSSDAAIMENDEDVKKGNFSEAMELDISFAFERCKKLESDWSNRTHFTWCFEFNIHLRLSNLRLIYILMHSRMQKEICNS